MMMVSAGMASFSGWVDSARVITRRRKIHWATMLRAAHIISAEALARRNRSSGTLSVTDVAHARAAGRRVSPARGHEANRTSASSSKSGGVRAHRPHAGRARRTLTVNGTTLLDAVELLAVVVQKRRAVGLGGTDAPAPARYRFWRSGQRVEIQTSRTVIVIVAHAAAKAVPREMW